MKRQRILQGLLLILHEEMKKTVILVDHDMNMVMDIAEEVMVLKFWRKISRGNTKAEIVKEKSNRSLFRSKLIMALTMNEIYEEILKMVE